MRTQHSPRGQATSHDSWERGRQESMLRRRVAPPNLQFAGLSQSNLPLLGTLSRPAGWTSIELSSVPDELHNELVVLLGAGFLHVNFCERLIQRIALSRLP